MPLRNQLQMKLTKKIIDILSFTLDRVSLRHLYIYLGRKLGFGLAVSCEKEVSALLQLNPFRGIKRPIVMFDVGANIGDYTQAVVDTLMEVEVYAFEPNPRTFDYLTQRFREVAKVKVFNYAVGRYSEDGFISESKEYDPSSTVFFSADRGLPIKIVRLKDFVRSRGIQNVDFLKIDAEGMDLEVLLGAEEILSSVTAIQFEISPSSILKSSLGEFFNLLYASHDIYILSYKGLELLPVYEYSDEIYWGANFVAILKNKL